MVTCVLSSVDCRDGNLYSTIHITWQLGRRCGADPSLESVVDGSRAYDGKSYSDLVDVWRKCLASPDIEDGNSGARRRLEELAESLQDVYCLKVGWRS